MQPLIDKIEATRKGLVDHGTQIWSHAFGAGRGLARFARGEATELLLRKTVARRGESSPVLPAVVATATATGHRAAGGAGSPRTGHQRGPWAAPWLRPLGRAVWRETLRQRRATLHQEGLAGLGDLERRVLSHAGEKLGRLNERVQDRFGLVELALRRVETRVQALERRASPRPAGEPRAALEGHDKMTAKDIVARLGGLGEPELRAILAWERAHKQRVTVLRAVEERLQR